GFRETLISRGVAADRLSVIYNWAPAQQPETSAGCRHDGRFTIEGRFTIVFAGTMGLAQGLDAVLGAAALVPHARFLFVGSGVDAERLERRAGEMRLRNV